MFRSIRDWTAPTQRGHQYIQFCCYLRQPIINAFVAAITFLKFSTVADGKSEIFFLAKSSIIRLATRPLLKSGMPISFMASSTRSTTDSAGLVARVSLLPANSFVYAD